MSVNHAVWWAALAGGILKIALGLCGMFVLQYHLLDGYSLLRYLLYYVAAWVYALTFPDGSQREGAEDILNIVVLPGNSEVCYSH